MPSVIQEKLRSWREFRVQQLGQRITHLTECIDGTDAEMYPDLVADYHAERQAAALKRSELSIKLGE